MVIFYQKVKYIKDFLIKKIKTKWLENCFMGEYNSNMLLQVHVQHHIKLLLLQFLLKLLAKIHLQYFLILRFLIIEHNNY